MVAGATVPVSRIVSQMADWPNLERVPLGCHNYAVGDPGGYFECGTAFVLGERPDQVHAADAAADLCGGVDRSPIRRAIPRGTESRPGWLHADRAADVHLCRFLGNHAGGAN